MVKGKKPLVGKSHGSGRVSFSSRVTSVWVMGKGEGACGGENRHQWRQIQGVNQQDSGCQMALVLNSPTRQLPEAAALNQIDPQVTFVCRHKRIRNTGLVRVHPLKEKFRKGSPQICQCIK